MTSDIYDLANYVNAIKQQFNGDINSDTLMVGIFGMYGELFSNIAQNTIVMASEFANESIPTKAKFEKNIISHALNLGIQTLNANPAKMDAFLLFIEDEIIEQMIDGVFQFDCDNKIYFGEYEFHTDYDIIIKRVALSGGSSFTYTAMYNMTGEGVYDNPVSDITNPYINPPVVININGTNYIFVVCTIRQVEKKQEYKKVLTDNTIASKTANFEFESQLAAFTVDVVNDNETVHLVPIYEGLVSKSKYPYVWFTYLDTNTIRIKFDKNSYSPRVNSDITINVQTTQGESGNFAWGSEDYPTFSFESERNKYTNITSQVRPANGESMYGTDKKSIKELKRVIAVEALARGSITNTTDLQNYFNSLDTEYSEMYFYKKRDNALERLYYSFICMKNLYNNVIPTNTLDMILDPAILIQDSVTDKLVLPKGTNMVYVKEPIEGEEEAYDEYVRPLADGEIVDFNSNFYYTLPYSFAISREPLYGMYYLTTMDVTKNLEFIYINDECQYQYISTYLTMERRYLTETNTYKIRFSLEQNLLNDDSMIYYIDEHTGNMTRVTNEIDEIINPRVLVSKVKAFIVLYNEEDTPYRWVEGTIENFNESVKIADFLFTFTSNDTIDYNNRIRIDGVKQVGKEATSLNYGHLPSTGKAMIHIVTKQPEFSRNKVYKDILGNIVDITTVIPNLNLPEGEDINDWCITNSYNIINGLDYFFDYSEIVYSTVDPILVDEDTQKYLYRISNTPMVKMDYFKTEELATEFFDELLHRKYYIDEAITVLEDSFGMNFKFFNTYGPSHLFTLDDKYSDYINRINISLRFKLSLYPNYDPNITTYIRDDITEFVNSITSINSLHMSNLVTQITKTYPESINYFEFVDMNYKLDEDELNIIENGYGPGVQHIFAMDMPKKVITPEIISLHTKKDHTPDIWIDIV